MPESPDQYAVVVEVPVAWGDMDAFGHVNNVQYFRYFEVARIIYFERAHMLGAAVGPILASTSCRFRAPVKYPDTLRVGARVAELARDRFTMRYAAWSAAMDCCAATGDGVIVPFDYEASSKAPIPKAWLAAFREIDGISAS